VIGQQRLRSGQTIDKFTNDLRLGSGQVGTALSIHNIFQIWSYKICTYNNNITEAVAATRIFEERQRQQRPRPATIHNLYIIVQQQHPSKLYRDRVHFV